MGIDPQVAAAAQLQIHGGVLGQERQHVIEKRHACPHGRFADAVKIERHRDSCFPRDALDRDQTFLHDTAN